MHCPHAARPRPQTRAANAANRHTRPTSPRDIGAETSFGRLGCPMRADRRLRIGIDVHQIGERQTGNERFIANLVPAIRAACDHDLVLYFTHADALSAWPAMPRTTTRLVRPAAAPVRIPVSLAWHALRDHLDVLLVQYTGPPLASCPVVTVVHDVAFALFPHFFTPRERIWMRRTIPVTIRRAAAIVTVSEFSKAELRRVFPVTAGRDVTVAHDAVDPVFADATRRRSPLEPPFVLAVGNLQPRKNLETLIRAFDRLLERRPDLPERLVLVGKEVFAAASVHAEAARLRDAGRIVFTGYVPDGDLVGLMQGASAFAYPSVYEGFGLPPLEAMAAGVPAILSDIPVTREIHGDGALRVPPMDVDAWSDGLERILTDPALRARLTDAGRARAARYTWTEAADRVVAALERASAARDRSRPRTGIGRP